MLSCLLNPPLLFHPPTDLVPADVMTCTSYELALVNSSSNIIMHFWIRVLLKDASDMLDK